MIYTTRKINKEKLMQNNPTLIGRVSGIEFFEHPFLGDESPLIAVTTDHCGLTEFYELPTSDEVQQASA